MPTGTVRFFNAQKGYGFIRLDTKAVDILIRAHDLLECGGKELAVGMRVRFEETLNSCKLKVRATNLKMI